MGRRLPLAALACVVAPALALAAACASSGTDGGGPDGSEAGTGLDGTAGTDAEAGAVLDAGTDAAALADADADAGPDADPFPQTLVGGDVPDRRVGMFYLVW